MNNKFYKFEIYSKILKLEKYIHILKSRHYSNNSPIRLADDLEKILSIIRKNIDAILDVHLQEVSSFLDSDFLQLCSFIEKSSPSYIPWSLIPDLEEITRKLISSNEIVIIRSNNYFNYSIHVADIISEYLNIIRGYVGELDDLKDEKFSRPRIFTIPLLEKNNILLHAILFHEIGHFYENKFSDSDEIKKVVNDTIGSLLKDGENYTAGTLFTAGEAISILKGFIREIYSDIFAFYYCGLSFLFSMYHFQKAYPEPELPRKKNNFYPPIKYRLRIIYRMINVN